MAICDDPKQATNKACDDAINTLLPIVHSESFSISTAMTGLSTSEVNLPETEIRSQTVLAQSIAIVDTCETSFNGMVKDPKLPKKTKKNDPNNIDNLIQVKDQKTIRFIEKCFKKFGKNRYDYSGT